MVRRTLLIAALLIVALPTAAADRFITVASTTSTQDSGLFGHILPLFRAKTGIEVRVVALGTGQAIKLAERGDADVLLVHHKPSEEKFVADGFGVKRLDVMYNDFVLIGPTADPAGIKNGRDIAAALAKIAATKAPFASRGDNSGTHLAELDLWKAAGIDAKAASTGWYRSLGSGMGPTLNTAAGMNAHVVSDRATWANFKNRQGLTILVEGDTRLFNQYGVVPVNPARHAHVKARDGQAFVDWLITPGGQAAIATYKIGGEQLFFPNTKKESS